MGDFRSTRGTLVLRESTILSEGFSNFAFVDDRYESHPVLRRILSIARKLGYQSLVVEEFHEETCERLAEEGGALRLRTGQSLKCEAHRLLFFSSKSSVAPLESDFLGYAVFVFVPGYPDLSHVYECVLKPPRDATSNNYLHCKRRFKIESSLGNFTVEGVLYAQQNNRTYVCAHVGLRTALSCVLPEGDVSYSEINQIVGIDHSGKKLGDGVGLGPLELEKVLQAKGIEYTKIVHEPQKQIFLPTDFQHHVYGSIESGSPALVAFQLNPGKSALTPAGAAAPVPRHVIPVFGHTFNEDTWVAEGGRQYFGTGLSYYPSEKWLSAFVMHDDNFGPYYCLPRNFLTVDNFRLILGLKPMASKYDALEAEAIGLTYFRGLMGLDTENNWFLRFKAYCSSQLLVLRAQLLKKADYEQHLSETTTTTGQTIDKAEIDFLTQHLPETLWLVEASAPELFSVNRQKFGELVLDASKPAPTPLDISLLGSIRMPGHLLRQNGMKVSARLSAIEGHTTLFARKPWVSD